MVASAVCLVEFSELLDINRAPTWVNTFHPCDIIRELRITKIAHVNAFLLLSTSVEQVDLAVSVVHTCTLVC